MAVDLGMIAVFVLMIAGQMIWVAMEWRRSGLQHPLWTSGDRKQVRTLRTITLSSVAAAWAIVLVNIAHRPDLIHESRMFSIAVLPLALTSLTLTLSFIAPRRGYGDFRAFLFTGALICAGLLGTSLVILALTWSTHQ